MSGIQPTSLTFPKWAAWGALIGYLIDALLEGIYLHERWNDPLKEPMLVNLAIGALMTLCAYFATDYFKEITAQRMFCSLAALILCQTLVSASMFLSSAVLVRMFSLSWILCDLYGAWACLVQVRTVRG